MEWISDNVCICPMGGREGMRPGQVTAGHSHNFDHTSIFFCRRWRVRRWRPIVNKAGEPQRLADGSTAYHETDDFERDTSFHVLTEANSKHEFTFLGPDNVVGRACCVFSHHTPQGEVVEHHAGWHQAYQ